MKRVKVDSIISFLIAISMLAFAFRGKIGAALITAALVLLIGFKLKRGNLLLSKYNVWNAGFILCFAVLLNIARTLKFEYYMVIGYLLAAILLTNTDENMYESLWKWLKGIAVFEAVGIYLQRLMPAIYYLMISIILPDSVVSEIRSRLTNGYYTGFSREVSYTMFLITIGLGLFIFDVKESRKIKQKKAVRLSGIIFLAGALLLSGKRATLLFFIVTVFAVFFIKSKNKFKIIKYTVICMGAIFLVGLTYPLWSKMSSLQRMVELISYIQANDWIGITNGRTVIYEKAYSLWKLNQWFGIGWGNFKYSVPDNLWYSGYDVHNCYLQVLCENGILGACIYYILIVSALVNSVRCIHYTDVCSYKHNEACFSGYMQVFFILYSLTEPILYEYTDYILFFICINFTSIILRRIKNKKV